MNYSHRAGVAALAILVLLLATPAAAQRLYVDADASGTGDGSSWENAFTDLQSALQQTELGLADEVWVASGIYSPGDNLTDTFTIVDGVSVVGGFAGGEVEISERKANYHAIAPTILDGDYDNDSATSYGDATANYSVVTFTGSGVLDGFTVTGGNESRAPSAVNANGVGGGIKIDGGTNSGVSATIINAVLRDNSSAAAGASIAGVNAGYMLINSLITESGDAPEPQNVVAAAAGRTGLLAADASYPIFFYNVTIAGNGGQAFFDAEAQATIELTMANSIMYNNALSLPDNSSTFQETQASLTNVIFEQEATFCGPGGITCTNVSSTDPALSTEDGFYTLTAGSIALDYGDSGLLPVDVWDLDGDGDVNEMLPLDGANRERILDAGLDAGAFEGPRKMVDDTAVQPGNEGVEIADLILAAAPNPFSEQAAVTLETAVTKHLVVKVYDTLGREVAVLHDGTVAAGEVLGVTLRSDRLPNGLYFVHVTDGVRSRTLQLTLVR